MSVMRTGSVSVAVVVAFMGCDADKTECETSLSKVSEMISAGDLAGAEKALAPELKRRCSDVQMLSKVGWRLKEEQAKARARKREAKEKTRVAKSRKAMAEFLNWVAQHVDAPDKIGGDVECYGPGDPEAGFCESGVVINNMLRSAAWKKTDPKSFEFESASLPGGPEVTCNDFGAQQQRRWKWRGAGILSHCVLGVTPRPKLNGMHLWIKNAENGSKYLRVFSDAYLKVAPYDFARTLKTQGSTL